jgi:predicted nucleic acid-binding protein
MSVFLADTNILVDALNAKRGRRELLRSLLRKRPATHARRLGDFLSVLTKHRLAAGLVRDGNQLACCAVTIAEVYSGMREHETAMTDQLLSSLVWYDIFPLRRMASWSLALRVGA